MGSKDRVGMIILVVSKLQSNLRIAISSDFIMNERVIPVKLEFLLKICLATKYEIVAEGTAMFILRMILIINGSRLFILGMRLRGSILNQISLVILR